VAASQRVLIVSEHPYPSHATLRRNVAQLLDLGVRVDLLCIASTKGDHPHLRIFSLPMQHKRTGAARYLEEYVVFFVWALTLALGLAIRHRYDAVLVDNPQDFLIFTTLPARLRGARVVLEMFELTPELTAARMRISRRHPIVQLTRWIERIAFTLADHVIVVSQKNQDLLTQRGLDARKVSILPNTIPVAILPAPPNHAGSSTFIVTHCSLIERYGVQVAIRAFALLHPRWPELRLRVLGEGELKPALVRLTGELGLDDRVVFRGFRPWDEAMAEISQAAVGVVAIVADGYGELLFPTKLLEYVQHDVPVACARLPTIADYFADDSLAFFEPGDPADLARQIEGLLKDGEAARGQARRAKVALSAISWDVLAPRYIAALGLDTRSPAAVEAC